MSASLKSHPRVDDWIRLDTAQVVTVRTGKVEIGQRINTALIMTAAAELSIDPARIRLDAVSTAVSPNEGMTSGSNSIEQSEEAVRLAAVSARHELLRLAASTLECDAASLELADGLVRERNGNRSASFWELLPGGRFEVDVRADALDVPQALDESLANGLRERRAARLASGEEQFVQDYLADDLLHARVVRPPHANARLLGIDESRFTATEAILLVRDGSFLAVAALDEFDAVNAAMRLAGAARWDRGDGVNDRDIFERLRSDPAISLAVVEGRPVDGPIAQVPAAADDSTIARQAVYERGYQMHGSIGPSAARARMCDGVLEVWTHSQGIYPFTGVGTPRRIVKHRIVKHRIVKHRTIKH